MLTQLNQLFQLETESHIQDSYYSNKTYKTRWINQFLFTDKIILTHNVYSYKYIFDYFQKYIVTIKNIKKKILFI